MILSAKEQTSYTLTKHEVISIPLIHSPQNFTQSNYKFFYENILRFPPVFLCSKSWYLPGEAPEISSLFEVKLLSREQHQNTHKLKFLISGKN